MITLGERKDTIRRVSEFRNASDLRIQFMCEYRLHLLQKLGQQTATSAGIRGELLHREVASSLPHMHPQERRWAPLLIAILAAVLGILWILG